MSCVETGASRVGRPPAAGMEASRELMEEGEGGQAGMGARQWAPGLTPSRVRAHWAVAVAL